ncbi:MAG TPA: DedA family protein [Verrucomicrobiae bacterium]|jgi:membrane protein DedA with SNARE-associated domain|nr:DedA family protein [Verrucomicrobiae bacterium]
MKHFLEPIVRWYLDHLSYSRLALLMAAESTIFPLPSEVIIPPAAASGKFSVVGIIIAGTLGSWIGASIMYWVSRTAGRPLVAAYGRYVGISPEKIEGAERWSAKFGSMGIFISRLLPVVRHLIGIPAGIVRMDYRLFSLFTVLGSGIWCAILCWLGIKMGQDEQLMKGEYHRIVIWVGGAMVVLGSIYYFFVHRHMKAAPGK